MCATVFGPLVRGALVAAAVALVPQSARADERVLAGIELGGKGAKLLVLRVPGDGGPAERLFAKTLDPNPLADAGPDGAVSAAGTTRTANAVAEFAQLARERFGVRASELVVVGSSGLASAPNRAAVADAVRAKSGCSVRFVSAEQEAALVFRGLVAPSDRETTMALDVGSGNARACAEGRSADVGPWRVSGTVPFGSVTAARAEPAAVARVVRAMADGHPTLAHHRARCHLTGGAAWALVTLVKPEAARAPVVQVTAADVAAFAALVERADGRFPEVRLDGLTDPEAREAAAAELARVRDTFSPDQLRAAALLLTEFARGYRFADKEVTFRRDGQFAWLLAHLHAEPEPEPSGPVPVPMWSAPCHPRCGPFRRK